MIIRLLAFGITRDIVGGSVSMLEIGNNVTVADLAKELKQRYPPLDTLRSLAIAVNGAYASAGTVVKDTDEVALIPPVSGG